MAAYVVVDVEVTKPGPYEEYKRMAVVTIEAFGGRYLVRGGPVETLEGDWPTNRFVILEFPNLQRAREWWASQDYRPARDIRHACARSKMILIEGV